MSVYFRAERGGTVHREGCRLAKPDLQWTLVDGKTPDHVLNVISHYEWLHACKLCWPTETAS